MAATLCNHGTGIAQVLKAAMFLFFSFALLACAGSCDREQTVQDSSMDKNTAGAVEQRLSDDRGQASYRKSVDKEVADTIEQWLSEGRELWEKKEDLPSLIAFYAERQLGITYVGGLLDEPESEQLVVTLEGSDCVLFTEMSQALTLTTIRQKEDFEDFASNLQRLRYRDGHMDGYISRLHYFSDWLMTNQEEGLITILFQDEGLPVIEPPFFMSRNRENYRHFAENDELYEKIRAMEASLAGRELAYIPQERIPEFEHRLHTGDIIGFVTTIEGLDITHTGLVRMEGDRAGFYHASTVGAVIVDEKTIHEYATDRRAVKGLVAARLRIPE